MSPDTQKFILLLAFVNTSDPTSDPFVNDRVAYAYVIAGAVGVSEPWALADFLPL